MLAGALADPVDSALFIWKDSSQEVRQQPHTLPAAHACAGQLCTNLAQHALLLMLRLCRRLSNLSRMMCTSTISWCLTGVALSPNDSGLSGPAHLQFCQTVKALLLELQRQRQ